MVVKATAGGLAGRARMILTRVDHTDKQFTTGLVEDHLGHLPGCVKAKQALVELSAVHERKLPPKIQLKTACSTNFGVDPYLADRFAPKQVSKNMTQ
jgi:hypothetical protein